MPLPGVAEQRSFALEAETTSARAGIYHGDQLAVGFLWHWNDDTRDPISHAFSDRQCRRELIEEHAAPLSAPAVLEAPSRLRRNIGDLLRAKVGNSMGSTEVEIESVWPGGLHDVCVNCIGRNREGTEEGTTPSRTTGIAGPSRHTVQRLR